MYIMPHIYIYRMVDKLFATIQYCRQMILSIQKLFHFLEDHLVPAIIGCTYKCDRCINTWVINRWVITLLPADMLLCTHRPAPQ